VRRQSPSQDSWLFEVELLAVTDGSHRLRRTRN
jgi:hypothetical protein